MARFADGEPVCAVDAPVARLSAHPLSTWLRLRFGLRHCLACGLLGWGGLQPASPLVPPQLARTWRCVDRLNCRTNRLRRGEWS